jgi:hypothetical protein
LLISAEFHNFATKINILQTSIIIFSMKKLFFIAVAALTLGFASCSDNKSDDAAALIENLKAQLEAGDASALQATLQNAKDKVVELVAKNPEAAKTYVVKIQEFIKENKEKITAVIGDNAMAQNVVNTLVDTPAETVVSALTAGQAVFDNAQNAADGLIDQAVNEQIEAAEDLNEDVNKQVNEAIDQAGKDANEAIDKAAAEAKKALGL